MIKYFQFYKNIALILSEPIVPYEYTFFNKSFIPTSKGLVLGLIILKWNDITEVAVNDPIVKKAFTSWNFLL